MLAHDAGVSRSAKHRHLIQSTRCRGRVIPWAVVLFVLLSGPFIVEAAQPIPDRSPGPRIEVEPPVEHGPQETDAEEPEWVLASREVSQEDTERALEFARANDPASCLEALGTANSEQEKRLAFACYVLLGERLRADNLFHELHWEDGGATGARLAAWRGIEERDPGSVERSLNGLEVRSVGDETALLWARWQRGQSLDGYLPFDRGSGSQAQFLLLAQAYEAGSAEALRDGTIPAEWANVAEALETSRQSGAVETLHRAYEEAQKDNWGEVLAQSNKLLALHPNSEVRGEAYLLRCMARLARGEVSLARSDFSLARNFLDDKLPVQLGLMDVFLSLQEGDGVRARNHLERLRLAPMAAEHEPMLLFHAARLARFQGRDDATVDALLMLEEAYANSPWLDRAHDDVNSPAWGLPMIEFPIPEASQGEWVEPPNQGPFGAVLWGDDLLARTAWDVEHNMTFAREEISLQEEPLFQARPSTAKEATIMAGGGSRDTKYVEWDWNRENHAALGYRIRGSWTHAQEGSALPESRRTHVDVALRKDQSAGVSRLGVDWDSRTEGETAVRARGGAMEYTFVSEDLEATRGISSASLYASFGHLSAQESRWEHAWIRTAGEGWHPVLFGDLQSSWKMEGGLQRQEGTRVTPWLLAGGLYLPVGEVGRVGIDLAGSRKEFYALPSASFQLPLSGPLSFHGAWEPRMAYPDYHGSYMKRGDWNVPDFHLAPVVEPVRISTGLRWEGLRTTVKLEGTHYRADNYRSWTQEDGLWSETGLDEVQGYRLGVASSTALPQGALVSVRLENGRVEQGGARVPFTPAWTGRLEVGIPWKNWFYGGVLEGISGRRDQEGVDYGSYVGVDLEATYHTPVGIDASARIVNVTNSAVRRWPDRPIFSRGVYAGIGYRFGT